MRPAPILEYESTSWKRFQEKMDASAKRQDEEMYDMPRDVQPNAPDSPEDHEIEYGF